MECSAFEVITPNKRQKVDSGIKSEEIKVESPNV